MTRASVNRLTLGAVVAAAAWTVWSCQGDPTASLRSGPRSLSLKPGLMFINEGTTKGLEVQTLDDQLNPLAVPVTVTTLNANVATVAIDSTQLSANDTRHVYIVSAVAPGQTKLVVTGGSVTDTATIDVLPIAFTGVLSSTTPAGGSLITIHSTAVLKFDPATTGVLFGGDIAGTIQDITADSLRVVVPFSDPGKLTVQNVVISYVPGLKVDLPSIDSVIQTGDAWGTADSSFATAPSLTMPGGAGQTVQMITNLQAINNDAQCGEGSAGGSTGPCMVYKFTLAAPTSLLFSADWEDTNTDIDIYACPDPIVDPTVDCFESGGSGASGRKPEFLRMLGTPRVPTPFTYAAGVHYFVVELFGGPVPKNVYISITQP